MSDITGTENDDLIIGTDASEVISGGQGEDDIIAGDGNDVVNGGDGSDFVQGGQGNDIVRGGDGSDVVRGGSGDDTVRGDQGVDRLFGGRGSDIYEGGTDRDFFNFETRDVVKNDVDTVVDFGREEGDKIRFKIKNLDDSDLDEAFNNPGQDVLINDEPGDSGNPRYVSFRVEYVEGPAQASAAGRTYDNDAGELDTKITFTLKNGAEYVIWVWNTQLTQSDFQGYSPSLPV